MSLLRGLGASLLINRHWTQVVVKNIVWATLAEGTVRGLKLIVLPLIARVFGPAEFGRFAFAYSFASMFGIVFDSGLALTTTRELATTKGNEELLPDILLIRLVLGGVGLAAMALGMRWVTRDHALWAMIMVLGLAFFVLELVNLAFAVFRARQRMEYEFVVRVIQTVFLVAAVALVAWRAPSALHVSYAYLVSGVMTVGVLLAVMRDGRWRVRRSVRVEAWRRLFRIALPLALAGGATTIYMNIDSVLLGAFGRITETGWYNLATRVVGILLVPTGLLSLVIFPAFASTAARVDEAFRKRWDAWSVGMVALGAYLAWLVLATADPAVGWIFGAAFRPAALVLKILAIAVLLVFVYTPSYQAMIVFDRQRTLSWALLSGAALNVVLNLALIPPFGLYGAAWATVATHAALLCALVVFAGKSTPVRPLSGVVVRGLLGAGVSGGVAWAVMVLAKVPLWLGVPLGSLLYVAGFLGMGRSRAAAVAVGLLGR